METKELKDTSITSNIFTFDGAWDGDQECMYFYDVTLKIKIDRFEIGSKFKTAVVDYINSCFLLENDNETHAFEMLLIIGKRITDEIIIDGKIINN